MLSWKFWNELGMGNDYYAIGVITGARGIRGEIKVKPLTDHPERFNNLKSIMLYKNDIFSNFEIKRLRFFRNLILIFFSGIDTRDDAEKLTGAELVVERNELFELEPDEYYWFDLIDMSVITTSGKYIGKISRILEGAANDVYVVMNGQKEYLIPAVKQYIEEVDLEQKRMIIEPIPGLLDDDNI